MLAVQECLRSGKPPEKLTEELGIAVYRHPSLPLVGFKYSQIESPKTHPVVRDCRGIVLEDGSWDVVAKPFKRFFNVGEDEANFKSFDWSDFTATEKLDGSLILLYAYRGEWHVNTSGSFGLGPVGASDRPWRDLFWETSRIDRERLGPELTYVFELWTPHNHVVRAYPEPAVWLLTAFRVPKLTEISVEGANILAEEIGVPRPEHYRFSGREEMAAFLRGKEETDKTFEGVVIRDRRGERWKAKSSTYVALHHLKENGNVFLPSRLVPLALAGEAAEAVAYLPEIGPHLEAVEARLAAAYAELRSAWEAAKGIGPQKDFALAVVKATPFSGLLFDLKKRGTIGDEAALRAAWRGAGDAILKRLF